MRILIADDNAEIRGAVRLLLEELGEHDIVEAADSGQVLDVALGTHPEAILLDWELADAGQRIDRNADPRCGSAALVQEVRRRCPGARIIAISANPEAQQSSRLAGCEEFVSRNEPPDRLIALLRIGDCG
jgi:CheY-like chemotaxis protein